MKAKKLGAFLLAAVMGMSVLTGCGSSINADAVGATLEGEEISLGFMNFMARYQQAIYDGYYSSMFGSDFWSQDLYGNGSDMVTTVKDQTTENIEILYLLEDHMKDYDVTVTKEEMTAIDKAAKQFMSDNTKTAIAQVGATEEYVKEMLRLNTIQKKMKDAMNQEVDTNVTDEEAAQKTFSYVKVNKTSTTDAEGKTVDYTDAEKAELTKSIEGFAQKAKTDLDAAAKTAGYTVSTYSYGSDESSFDKEVIAAVDALEEGQMTSLLDTKENYYIARLDSTFDVEKTTAKKESIVTKRQEEHYTQICDGYKKDVTYKVKKEEWKKVKFDDLFTVKQETTKDAAGK